MINLCNYSKDASIPLVLITTRQPHKRAIPFSMHPVLLETTRFFPSLMLQVMCPSFYVFWKRFFFCLGLFLLAPRERGS